MIPIAMVLMNWYDMINIIVILIDTIIGDWYDFYTSISYFPEPI